MYVYMYVYVCICECMYVCMYVCVYVWMDVNESNERTRRKEEINKYNQIKP